MVDNARISDEVKSFAGKLREFTRTLTARERQWVAQVLHHGSDHARHFPEPLSPPVVLHPGNNEIGSDSWNIPGAPNDFLTFTVEFDQAIDPTTVVSQATVIVSGQGDQNAAVTVHAASSTEFVLTTVKEASDISGVTHGDRKVIVKLIGVDTGAGAIKSTHGLALNGAYRDPKAAGYSSSDWKFEVIWAG